LKAWVERIDEREAVQKGLGVPHRRDPEEAARTAREARARIDALDNTA
jgi:hypothetical protein